MTREDDAVRIRTAASGASADEAYEKLPPLYNGTRWYVRGVAGRYDHRYSMAGDTSLSLRQSVANGHIEGDIPPGDDYVVQWLTRGDSVVDFGRDPVSQRINRPLLFPAHRPFVFTFDGAFDQRLVHLSRATVDDLAHERFGIPVGGARFDHTAAISPAAATRWMAAVAALSAAIHRGGINALAWAELRRVTANAFLDLYPPRASEAALPTLPPGDARLHLALEIIHAEAHLPLTTADIAEAVGLSSRAVQAMFQRSLDMTPVAYIRRVRLGRVHDELLLASPGDIAVADVAVRWGFVHLGRFAAWYHAAFGERPRDTLRR